MYTHKYKGFYIHGSFDKDEVHVTSESGKILGIFKNHRAGQVAITKCFSQCVSEHE